MRSKILDQLSKEARELYPIYRQETLISRFYTEQGGMDVSDEDNDAADYIRCIHSICTPQATEITRSYCQKSLSSKFAFTAMLLSKNNPYTKNAEQYRTKVEAVMGDYLEHVNVLYNAHAQGAEIEFPEKMASNEYRLILNNLRLEKIDAKLDCTPMTEEKAMYFKERLNQTSVDSRQHILDYTFEAANSSSEASGYLVTYLNKELKEYREEQELGEFELAKDDFSEEACRYFKAAQELEAWEKKGSLTVEEWAIFNYNFNYEMMVEAIVSVEDKENELKQNPKIITPTI